MKKTSKMASVREPRNYWIKRRIYEDDCGNEFVKINYNFVSLAWLEGACWDIVIDY